jgi:hypothetical protein
MRSNPFYALSACAMMLGCWLLSEALHLQAGQLGGLLVLVAVLQLYEGLLVGLGTFLVRTGRAPRDGVVVLVLESVFLADATLLAAECVTADARVGTGVVVGLAALAVAKLAWVRRAAPGVLSSGAAVLLGAHAVFVLALPAAAAHLAWLRVLGPIALYGLWWSTAALPLAQRALHTKTLSDGAAASRWHAVWTWTPGAMVLLHLWAVGYIHSVDFQPAFLAPLLLGLAVMARPEQLARQVALPGLAALVSLGQQSALAGHAFGVDALLVSPFRLAVLGIAATWAYLAWRDRQRWLAVLAVSCVAAGVGGSLLSAGSALFGRALACLGPLLPRDTFGWGLLTVVAAFAFLAAGVRRSLGNDSREGPSEPPSPMLQPPADRPRRRGREWAAASIALAVFALTVTVSATRADGRGQAAVVALLAAAAAFAVGVRALSLCAHQDNDPAGKRLAGLAIASSVLVGMMCLSVPSSERAHVKPAAPPTKADQAHPVVR